MAKKRRGLGAPDKLHRKKASTYIARAESAISALKKPATCSTQFDRIVEAESSATRARAHAFDSGMRVARGALTARTVSEADAKRLYLVEDEVDRAVSRFRSHCVKDEFTALAGVRRRNRRR